MSNNPPSVFLDANVLVYFLDETAQQHSRTVKKLQGLINSGSALYTSHHVLEEVLFIVSKLANNKGDVATAIKQIGNIPGWF